MCLNSYMCIQLGTDDAVPICARDEKSRNGCATNWPVQMVGFVRN